MSDVQERIDGVVIGIFLGFEQSAPIVIFPGNPTSKAVPARSLAELTWDMTGAEVAILFQDGDPLRPLIVGRIVQPSERTASRHTVQDGDTVKISAERRVELRCGKAMIVLEKDGRITIRGTYLTSHASAANRIRGGSVNLN